MELRLRISNRSVRKGHFYKTTEKVILVKVNIRKHKTKYENFRTETLPWVCEGVHGFLRHCFSPFLGA